MTRVLLVANRSLGSPEVSRFVRDRSAQQQCQFTLLVPATRSDKEPAHRLASVASGVLDGTLASPGDTEDNYEHARARLEYGLDLLAGLGATADGEIGDPDAGTAIEEILGRRQFDEVALSTLPKGISRWLGLDLPRRIDRKFHIPVTVIDANEGVSPTPPPV